MPLTFPNRLERDFSSSPDHEEQFKAQFSEEEEGNTRRNPRCKQQHI